MDRAAAQRDLESLGTQQQESHQVQQGKCRVLQVLFPPRWGNSPFRLTVLLQATFLKKHSNKIMVGWSLAGFEMFLVIH